MLRSTSLNMVVSFFFILTSYCSHAEAENKRVALVIGNSSYEYTSPLANPRNDAEDIATTLSSLGFEVMKRSDLDKASMDRTLAEFADALKGAKMGLFFYAGHGLQVSGKNYLVPIDASLKSASALDFEAVSLDVVQRLMENETQTNMLFLDACRDNPLTRNLARALGTRSSSIGKGLAAQESGAGTLISYSTQPGNVALDGTGGRNSPFAAALIKQLPTEGTGLPTLLVRPQGRHGSDGQASGAVGALRADGGACAESQRIRRYFRARKSEPASRRSIPARNSGSRNCGGTDCGSGRKSVSSIVASGACPGKTA